MAAVLVEGFVAVRRFAEPCDVLTDDCWGVGLFSIELGGLEVS